VIWLALPALAGAAYYALALIAAARWRTLPHGRVSVSASEKDRIELASGRFEGVSILKPIRGRDPEFYDAIRSHASQDYPEFEILFGMSVPGDPAAKDILRLQAEFPRLRIEIVPVTTDAPNAKAGVLVELARRARHPILLVNDSDIRVEPGYLRTVVAPLADSRVGLVTCLYRASAVSFAARAEALGIATEFAPSVLVARLLGVAEFALGSTMVFRAADLRAAGGFEAVADYLADDYQLGRRITGLGKHIEFAPTIVETALGDGSWLDVWRHQVRWSRTIRVSRTSGYYGYVVTHATLWGLVAIAAGQWQAGALALAVRMLAGIAVGRVVLRDRGVSAGWWLIPFRDLFGFAVWIGGLFGNHVLWRGKRLRLSPDGRIGR
jgi:ceramide glucosyltransferase